MKTQQNVCRKESPCEDTARKQPSARLRGVRRNQHCRRLDFGLQASKVTTNKFLLFKPPSLRYFVMAVLACAYTGFKHRAYPGSKQKGKEVGSSPVDMLLVRSFSQEF